MQAVYFFLFLLGQMFYKFFPDPDTQWFVGWVTQDATACILSFLLAKKYDYAQYKEKSFFIMFGVLHLFFVIYSVFDFRIGDAAYLATLPCWLIGFIACKQIFLIKAVPYEINNKNIFYGIYLPQEKHFANLLKPTTFAAYGGRIVIAGDYAYIVHKKKFKKVPVKMIAAVKENFAFIDTGIEISKAKKDLQRLDELVGKKFIPIFRDCSKLDAGKNLTLSIIESGSCQKIK